MKLGCREKVLNLKTVTCKECGEIFNLHSPEKRKVGGLVTLCIDCSLESTVRSIGLHAGDGKMSGVTILSFESQADREKYLAFWQNNSGLHKGKSCQLGSHLSTTPSVKFKILQAPEATNHKGKL